MDKEQTRALLQAVAEGALPVEEAVERLKLEPFEDLGFAKVDHHRALRQGAAEVIYGAGKTPEQIVTIAQALRAEHGNRTRAARRLNMSKSTLWRKLKLYGLT